MVATSAAESIAGGRPAAADGRMASLDGIRGLAVLIVLASHLSNAGVLPSPGMSGTGKAGVYLFFVLSAFLLADGLLHRAPGDLRAPRIWLDYALRRVVRIWPLYLIVLLVSYGLTRAGMGWHYVIDLDALGRHLALTEGRSVLWSIPVEFVFYAVLPWLVLLLRGSGRFRHAALMQVAVLAVLMVVAHQLWPPAEAAVNDVRLGPYLPVFLCGVAAAVLWRPAALPGGAWASLGVAALAAFVLTIPAVWSGLSGEPLRADRGHRWFIGYGLLWAAFLVAVLRGPRGLRRPFESRPMAWLGRVSYSLYLWHMPVIALVVGAFPEGGIVRLVIALLAIGTVSAASYGLVERPFLRLRLAPRPAMGPSP